MIVSSAAIQHVCLQAASLTTSLTANSAMAQLQGCHHDPHVFHNAILNGRDDCTDNFTQHRQFILTVWQTTKPFIGKQLLPTIWKQQLPVNCYYNFTALLQVLNHKKHMNSSENRHARTVTE